MYLILNNTEYMFKETNLCSQTTTENYKYKNNKGVYFNENN